MSTAANPELHNAVPADEQERNLPLPLRGDTFLGVFEAIGQDFGFNPNWMRIPFAALILWNPAVIIGTYLALGCVVALSRWLFPANARAAAPRLVSEGRPATEQKKDEELPIAA